MWFNPRVDWSSFFLSRYLLLKRDFGRRVNKRALSDTLVSRGALLISLGLALDVYLSCRNTTDGERDTTKMNMMNARHMPVMN